MMRRKVLYLVQCFSACVVGLTGCASDRRLPPLRPDPQSTVRRVADFVLKDFPQTPPFDWGEGVLMAGMIRAGTATGDARYVDFVRRWADHWHQHGIEPILNDRGYCGHWGPGFALLMLYEQTREQAYLDLTRTIVEFMQDQATRTTDGGLGHWRGNRQIWVDTLYMSCPLYANFGRLTGKPDLILEAALQLDISRRHLQDAPTGLFYHMYDEPTGRPTCEPWGRGNGWTAMAYVETLRNLDRRSPEYGQLAAAFRRLAAGLIASQDAQSGLWHTVLTRPESYLETSASAMILYSLIEGHRLGVIRLADMQIIVRGWQGLSAKVDAEGRVVDVSAGTGPTNYETYARIPRGTYTWGTGAFLIAASALAKP